MVVTHCIGKGRLMFHMLRGKLQQDEISLDALWPGEELKPFFPATLSYTFTYFVKSEVVTTKADVGRSLYEQYCSKVYRKVSIAFLDFAFNFNIN